MTDTPTTGQIIEQLKSRLSLAELHHQAARIELARRDAQIGAMMDEIERLRATVAVRQTTLEQMEAELTRCKEANRGLWGEIAERDMKSE